MKKPHLVREIKRYWETAVDSAMYVNGYRWDNPSRRPKDIEKMVQGLPRCALESILKTLEKHSTRRNW